MRIPRKIMRLCLTESKNRLLVKDKDRVDEYGEVFTPTPRVLRMLDEIYDDLCTEGHTVMDPFVGDGQLILPVAIIKQELRHTENLSTIYGVDIMQDNVDECRKRLLDVCGHTPENIAIVERNIVCADGHRYHYRFDGTDPYKTLDDLQNEGLWEGGL